LSSAYLGARALHIVAKLGVADALPDESDAEPATTDTLHRLATSGPRTWQQYPIIDQLEPTATGYADGDP
jgi:hypothetical protein